MSSSSEAWEEDIVWLANTLARDVSEDDQFRFCEAVARKASDGIDEEKARDQALIEIFKACWKCGRPLKAVNIRLVCEPCKLSIKNPA